MCSETADHSPTLCGRCVSCCLLATISSCSDAILLLPGENCLTMAAVCVHGSIASRLAASLC